MQQVAEKEIIQIMVAQLMAVTGVPNYTDLLFAKHTLLSYSHPKVSKSNSSIKARSTNFNP